MIKHILSFILLLSSFLFVNGEEVLRTGEWRSHFAYNNCFEIIETPTQVIGATSMGLIILEKSDYSLSTLTRINGLSDYGISTVNHVPSRQSIIIGYTNGNIDVLQNGTTTNINDLKIRQMDGSKRINHIHTIGDKAYCATDFAILVVDLKKFEFESTYFIGENASDLKIFQITSDADYLYAATEKGVLRARLDAPNIQIYDAWSLYSPDNLSYNSISSFGNGFVVSRGSIRETCTLMFLRNDATTNIANVSTFIKLRTYSDRIVSISSNAIRVYNNNFQLTQTIESPTINGQAFTPSFRDAHISSNNQLWIADFNLGLLNLEPTGIYSQYLPAGPLNNYVFQARFIGDKLWTVPGGTSTTWNNTNTTASVSVLTPTGWKYFTRQNTALFAGAVDLMSITENPKNQDNVFINSWGSGIFEVTAQEGDLKVTNNYFIPPNGLQSATGDNRRFVRVAATAFDRNNVLWATNSSVNNAIVAFYPDENLWIRYSYYIPALTQGLAPLLITSNGDIWLSIFREGLTVSKGAKGLFVWNVNNTPKDQSDDRYRGAIPPSLDQDNRNKGQLLLWDEEGSEITNNIYSMAEDQNGHIWMGTDRGIVVQYQPQTIFTREKPVFSRIKVPRRDGSIYADFLLGNEIVSAIAIDPANRKWLGTQGNGLFLVSADGTKEIHAFNTSNSPLPSDYISAITIDERSGEVYIATNNGLISFKGTATRGSNSYSDMYVYPNPVRPGFNGNITITGLVAKTNVKITDVSGKLVYETSSVGGQAFWDGRNLWGDSVKSGVYLIFVASEDGSQSAVTKVAIIR
ncbi:type IX secretion system anionic LPS delivery protein PorZ [Alkaliflexus imshenetskii]|uniref:type IX secretion system anionic LPS delivery protein PorZ n=1 Tax=Alkaliflexus imshenetskii TaxID=286730 RepID=UPI0004B9C6D2|nr:two-component regulator propeller domain-containing protein [Alkaliflexus imshenetskii]